MNPDPFIGNFVIEFDAEASSQPIGAGTEITIEKPGEDYKITATGSNNPVWSHFTARLEDGQLRGTITVPSSGHTIPFGITALEGEARIRCHYEDVRTETGSWTADDEGGDPEN